MIGGTRRNPLQARQNGENGANPSPKPVTGNWALRLGFNRKLPIKKASGGQKDARPRLTPSASKIPAGRAKARANDQGKGIWEGSKGEPGKPLKEGTKEDGGMGKKTK